MLSSWGDSRGGTTRHVFMAQKKVRGFFVPIFIVKSPNARPILDTEDTRMQG